MSQRTDFFDSPKDHSLIKLRFLEKYLKPWSVKVGSNPRTKRISVVDCFAGRGRYRDGTAGSPELILRRAQEVSRASASYTLAPVFVESNRANFKALEKVISDYPGVNALALNEEFSRSVDAIRAHIGDAPVLLLVDPFGIKDLDLNAVVALSNVSKLCDVVVTFCSPAVPRLASQHPGILQRAIGTEGTIEDPAGAFGANVVKASGFLSTGRFPVRHSIDSALKYELLLFSRARDAYQLANDFLTDEYREQQRASGRRSDQPPLGDLLDSTDSERDIEQACREILDWARQVNDGFPREAMLRYFYVERFATYNSKTLRAALKRLELRRELVAAPGRVDERIWRLAG